MHGGPRISTLAATAPGQFIALPNVTNSWSQLSFDLTYALSKKMAVGFSLLREDFDVSDFATINTGRTADAAARRRVDRRPTRRGSTGGAAC